MTAVVGLFLLRGNVIFGPEYYVWVKQILMPGYLVFCGTMFGYIAARVQLGYDDEHINANKIYIKSFIMGIVLGMILAIAYMFI